MLHFDFDPITDRELTLFGKSHPDVKPSLCIVFSLTFLRVCSLFKGLIWSLMGFFLYYLHRGINSDETPWQARHWFCVLTGAGAGRLLDSEANRWWLVLKLRALKRILLSCKAEQQRSSICPLYQYCLLRRNGGRTANVGEAAALPPVHSE